MTTTFEKIESFKSNFLVHCLKKLNPEKILENMIKKSLEN